MQPKCAHAILAPSKRKQTHHQCIWRGYTRNASRYVGILQEPTADVFVRGSLYTSFYFYIFYVCFFMYSIYGVEHPGDPPPHHLPNPLS